MKNLIKAIIMLFVLATATGTHAAEKYGFQTVPFGTSYEDVSIYLLEKYGVQPPLMPMETLTLSSFDLSGVPVDIIFRFTAEAKFYGFSIHPPERDIEAIRTVEGDAAFLAGMLKKKYGNKYTCKDFSILLTGRTICDWIHPDLRIFTALVGQRKHNYTVVAFISSKKYSKQFVEQKQREREKQEKAAADRF